MVPSILFLLAATEPSDAEDVKITTSYPSPYGVYQELSSSGDTNLGTDTTANVGIGTSTPNNKLSVNGDADFSGDVGIGTSTPNEQLEITGNLRLPPTTATAGIIRSGTALYIHSFGNNNFFAGANAGNLTMTGAFNTGVGSSALVSNTNGLNNTAAGMLALSANTGGSNNSAFGFGALGSNTIGSWNTASGQYALYQNTTGANNTAIGRGAGSSSLGEANTTGSKNTFIGAEAGPGTTTQLTNATAVGYGALVSQSNSLVLGGTGANAVKVGIGTAAPSQELHVIGNILASGTITPSSDARFKKNIAPLPGGILGKLDQIQGVSFNRNRWEKSPELLTEGPREMGVIGQDLERVFPELVTRWGEQEYRAVDYNGFTAVLLEAIKEQQKEIEELKKEIGDLKNQR